MNSTPIGWAPTAVINIVRYYPALPSGEYSGEDGTRSFLYFDRSAYGTPYGSFSAYQNAGGGFYSPQSFQVIQAGLDGTLGNGGSLSSEDDNAASFAGGTVRDLFDKNN